MTDKYAVLGHPIAHSKSPMIHAAFAKQTHQDISYEAILAPLDGFADTLKQLVADGYQGVNVTVPFKFEAFQLAHQRNMSVMNAEAANTLLFRENVIVAENTDGVGLVTDIQHNLAIALQGKRVLLIGAGGAAQGVAADIAKQLPSVFVVVNRSIEKVYTMQQKVAAIKEAPVTTITASLFESLGSQAFDIVINATSAGLTDSALPIPNGIFSSNTLAYDMMYGRETPFLQQARAAGARAVDGLGMLVEQAAHAFYLWRGVRPDTQAVIAQLRAN
ncbi:MAG: shikimate dehydrogenase [Methylophilaceae bacterium]|jgi:shikimate dehydrogenase|nr:MAG: shikimate dehydrogenase [Methylophilaceae bacterium]